MPEDSITFMDPTEKKRRVSDVTDTASDVIRSLINDHMGGGGGREKNK